MRTIEISTPIQELTFEELNDIDKELVKQAKEATFRSYVPYSKFHVGAAILLGNGKIVAGSNQENAAYPTGLCAERTAAFYASSANPGESFKKIAIAARNETDKKEDWEKGFQAFPISPCGGCRQALLEYENLYGDIEVILYGREKIYIVPNIKALLPLGFTEF